jgi:hypothetical protein
MNLKNLSAPELLQLLGEVNEELKGRRPKSIKCVECNAVFSLDKGKTFSTPLMNHLRKQHRYPYEDAGLSCGDRLPEINLNLLKTRFIY